MKPVLKFIPFFALFLLVPWWYSGSASGMDGFWGIPEWAWYAIGMTVFYAIVIAWMLGRFWESEAHISELESEHAKDEPNDEEVST